MLSMEPRHRKNFCYGSSQVEWRLWLWAQEYDWQTASCQPHRGTFFADDTPPHVTTTLKQDPDQKW